MSESMVIIPVALMFWHLLVNYRYQIRKRLELTKTTGVVELYVPGSDKDENDLTGSLVVMSDGGTPGDGDRLPMEGDSRVTAFGLEEASMALPLPLLLLLLVFTLTGCCGLAEAANSRSGDPCGMLLLLLLVGTTVRRLAANLMVSYLMLSSSEVSSDSDAEEPARSTGETAERMSHSEMVPIYRKLLLNVFHFDNTSIRCTLKLKLHQQIFDLFFVFSSKASSPAHI
jgi:hypothetical protein